MSTAYIDVNAQWAAKTEAERRAEHAEKFVEQLTKLTHKYAVEVWPSGDGKSLSVYMGEEEMIRGIVYDPDLCQYEIPKTSTM